MRTAIVLFVIVGTSNFLSAQTVTISGTIRDLRGEPVNVTNLQVRATQGNLEVGISPANPASVNRYSIVINSALVSAGNARVTLTFTADGSLRSQFLNITGRSTTNGNPVSTTQEFDVVLPEDVDSGIPCPQIIAPHCDCFAKACNPVIRLKKLLRHK